MNNVPMESPPEYKSWISELKLRYQNQQIKAAIHVNSAMLLFYERAAPQEALPGVLLGLAPLDCLSSR